MEIKHPLITLYSSYQSPSFIHHIIMFAPTISSLNGIYCKMNLQLQNRDSKRATDDYFGYHKRNQHRSNISDFKWNKKN